MPTPLPATPSPAAPAPRAQALVNGQSVGSVNAQSAGTDPNSQFTHLAGAFAPTGTMTANISSPNSTTTNPAPAVTTSSAAATDLANKQTQVNQLNTDTANHAAIVAGANQPVTTGTTSDTPPATTSTTSGTPTTDTSSLDDQINDILTSFGTQESSINDTANTQETNLANEQTAEQTALDTAASAAQTNLAAISSGTYPLSPIEQQTLSATTSTFQQALNYQQQANASQLGLAKEDAARLGIDTSAPSEAMSMMSNAIATGTQKITDIANQMSISLGNLEMGFQKQDYDMVQQSWEDTSTYMQSRITELQNMNTAVATAAKNQVDELQSATATNLSAIANAATFDQKTKQDLIQNAFTQQQITETQRHDLADEATAAETAMKGTYSFNADTGEVFDTRTGQVTSTGSMGVANGTVEPGQTGIPILDQNTKTSASGVPYIDGTNLTGAQASEAQLQAAKLGIPYMGKTQAAAAGTIDSVRGDIQNMTDTLAQIGPQNIFQRAINTVGNPISEATQIGGNAAALNAFNGYRTTAISAIHALAGAGSGNRITTTEINTMMNNIPSPNDSTATIAAKLAVLNGQLTQTEKGIFGSSVYDQYNPDQATGDLKNYAAVSPAHEQQVSQIHSAYPDLTPDQVLQLVQP